MKHLSDEKIQAYLDCEVGAERASIAASMAGHLRECPACQGAIDEYRKLYLALEDESSFALEMDVAARALSKVKPRERQERERDLVDTFAGALGIMSALGVAVWVYVRLGGVVLGGAVPDLGQSVAGFRGFLAHAAELSAYIGSAIMPVIHEIGTIVTAGVVIYLLLALDYLFLNHLPQSPAGSKPTCGD